MAEANLDLPQTVSVAQRARPQEEAGEVWPLPWIRGTVAYICKHFKEVSIAACAIIAILFGLTSFLGTTVANLVCDWSDDCTVMTGSDKATTSSAAPVRPETKAAVSDAAPAPAKALSDARIVIFDTQDPSEAYNDGLRAAGKKNADFLVDEVKKRGMTNAVAVFPAYNGTLNKSALVPAPVLAIVHRSTFEASNPKQGDAKIIELIKSQPDLQFIVYSRKPETGTSFLSKLQDTDGVAGRVQVVTLAQGDPWSTSTELGRLLNVTIGTLHAKGYGMPASAN